jgi:hypothetical protein
MPKAPQNSQRLADNDTKRTTVVMDSVVHIYQTMATRYKSTVAIMNEINMIEL